jgi:hypothetical protein
VLEPATKAPSLASSTSSQPDMLLQYSLNAPHGREDTKAFLSGFREAFSDLKFRDARDLIAESEWVGRVVGG